MEYMQGEAPHTVKYGGGLLMFWRYLSAIGPGALFKINSTINLPKYEEILAENVVASARKLSLGPQVYIKTQ